MNRRAAGESLTLADLVAEIQRQEEQLRQGGGAAAIERQHSKGRLTARERISRLIDPESQPLELGLWAAYEMYADWGGAAAA